MGGEGEGGVGGGAIGGGGEGGGGEAATGVMSLSPAIRKLRPVERMMSKLGPPLGWAPGAYCPGAPPELYSELLVFWMARAPTSRRAITCHIRKVQEAIRSVREGQEG